MRLWTRSTLGPCIALLLCALMAAPSAVAQIAGTNVNMVSGTQWPGGDPFLQRQNEPSIAVSSRNPFHLLAGANDYRTVDLALTTNGETGDAWLGLFKSLDGGATWRSTLLPGCPYNTSICAGAPAVKNAGYQAAADPTVRAGTNGMFYYAGLVFNRGLNPASAIIVSRLIDLNNKENADPNDILNGDSIQYIGTSILATGTSSQFLDKPTMAVDIPRFGATTCNLTVNQPGNGAVHQSFAAGNVYVAYTAFSEAPNTDPETATGPQLSKLYFVRSTNCGASWSTPVMISGNTAINQGASIAIDPMTGIVYVAWREFHYQLGTTNQPDAIVVAGSINGGKTFLPPLRISTFTPFDEGTTNTSFRTNAYPSIAVDNRSRVYVAYSARNAVPSGDARIVLTNALFGLIWSAPTVVDSPSVDPNNNPSGRGHQIMPTLTFAGGKLSLLYYDLRLDHTVNTYAPLFILGQPTGLYTLFPKLAGELGLTPPQAGAVFNQYIDDSTITIRRHTFDLRMAQASPGKLPVFAPSVLVSQYAYGCCATNQTDIEQLEFNAPNLPIFRSGTAPFMGDYVDLAAGPSFLPPTAAVVGNDDDGDADDGDGDADDWRYNLSSSNPTIFHAAWTDNRDVQAPADGDWTHYTPPNSPSRGSTSIFQPGTSVPSCQVGFTGSRNQNIYTAPISNGLVFGAPGNTKQLGTTVFNGQTFPFQRAFAVVTQNTTSLIKSFRMTIANQPPGGNASFLQFAQLTSLDLSIPPLSSASRPVFVTSTNPTASVTVNIAEITAPQGTLVPNGLSSSTTLNPDPTNPTITNPTISNPTISNPTISNFEVTNPTISNPTITNPTISNPTITNPTISNPTISNAPFQSVSVVNPTITNPTISNPTISNASIANPTISNPTISNLNPANTSISDTQWAVSNTGNTTGSFTINLASSSPVPLGNVLQLIISKLYQTPAAPTGQDCNLKVETHNQIVTNIVNPALLNPTDPTISNPTITNPTISNATVALDPGETANVIIRVVNTNTQTFPTFNPSASVTPVVVSQAVPTQTVLSSGGGTPPPPPITVPPLQITTTSLPDAVTGLLYVVAIQTVGGNPTAHTFSVTAGALPTGLTLDPVTGAIAGVVQATGTATFSFQVRVQDVGSPSFPQHTTTQNLSIRVGSALVFAPTTLPQATQGVSYSQTIAVTGGLGAIGLSLVGGNLPPGITFNGPSGVISGIPTASGPFSFTLQATDGASPPQIVSQSYTINVVSVAQVPANVTFVTQPGNSVGGQILTGSPVIVQVTDNTGAAIPGANVAMTFNPPPPCSAATLSGTLAQTTNAQGQATFSDLFVDRGQLGYTLLAISANATAVSNPFTVNGFCATSSLSTPRELHTEVLLGNGKVLLAGGTNTSGNVLSTAEIYDPVAGTFSSTGNLTAPNGRATHASVLLPNGQVLLLGGLDNAGNPLATAELYDPTNGGFFPTGSMAQARNRVSAVLLANGKVLVSGGVNAAGALNSAEVYDPATGSFILTGNMNQARARHTMTLLPNGRVLITGGRSFGGLPVTVFASAEIFDPTANSGVGAFTSTGNMNSPRDEGSATLLPNGTVLLTGGFVSYQTNLSASSAETFDPATGVFTLVGSMSTLRAHQTSSLLPDGTVLIAGGVPDTGTTTPAASSAEIFNAAIGTFSPTGTLTLGREFAQSVVLPTGNPLVSGGDDGVTTTSNQEIYYSTATLAPLTITTTSIPNGSTGQPYTQILLEQGGVGNLSWTETGSLPAGVSFSSQGVLSGTPTVAGSFPIAVTLTDSSTPAKSASSNLILTVTTAPLVFTSSTVPTAVVGRPFIQALPVAGGTQPYNATVTGGTLPPGLNLSSGGVLNGTPSGTGNFTFNVTVTDSSTPTKTATQTLTMGVNTLVITTTVLPNGIVGVPYTAPITTTGGTLPLSFSLTNTAFPPGLFIQQPSQVPPSSTGALAGTPTLAGTYTFSESVVDHSTPIQTATEDYTVTIAPSGTPAPATVTFVSQPQNSIGGQTLSGSSVVVRVADANNTPITGTTVAMNFNGAPPCAVATLSGALTAVTDATGQATFSNLSIDRGQLGYTLLASTGSASAVSQPFTVDGFCPTGSMAGARLLQTATLLPNGKVLVVGGLSDLSGFATVQNSAELYDANTGLFTPTGSMGAARELHTATLLPNGKVLIAGGNDVNLFPQASAELYDPSTNTFSPTGSMARARSGHTATLLPNGLVLIAGGQGATAEIYDPVNGTFTLLSGSSNSVMSIPRRAHTATLLPNGQVLIVGGLHAGPVPGETIGVATAELFDPANNTFTLTGGMSTTRARHVAVLLTNGKVLVAGGDDGQVRLASAELYDPSTGQFSLTGSLKTARTVASAALLPNGQVLVTNGASSVDFLSSAELFDPNSGTFRFTGSTITAHVQGTLTLLPTGNLLVTGGSQGNNVQATAEIYYSTAPLAPLQITTPSTLPAAILGQPYTQLLLEQGGVGTLTWALASSALPPGITLRADGVLIGTPTAGGTFTFTVNVVDSSNPQKNTTSGTFSLMVTAPITPLDFPAQVLNTGIPGVPYSTSGLTASGGTTPYNFAVTSGTPPAGITLAANGQFSGMPTGVGSSTFTVTVTDSSPPQQTASQSLTIQVVNPLAITTTTLPNGTAGTPYIADIASTGGVAPVAFNVTSGTPPSGLSLALSGSSPQTAVLSGTPTVANTFTLTIAASDASAPQQIASQTYTVTIAPAAVASAQVTFVTQPQNSIEGQVLTNSPVQLRVADTSNTPVPNVSVTIGFNGAPPCTAATLGGSVTQITDATGTATFSNLTINRGQFDYTLAATAGNVTGSSNTFNVEGFCDTSSLATARVLHSSVALPNGTILIAGGAPTFTGATTLSSAEVYNPVTHSFTTVGSMNSPRFGFTMTLLQNGLVLVAGGFNGSTPLSSAELFDPSTNTFTLLSGSLVTARGQHVATLLSSGKVLLTGGASSTAILASAELFDPTTNTFTATSGPMTTARNVHRADLLPNGQALITGGLGNGSNDVLASAELYDPIANAFTPTGNMATSRLNHASALLFTGKVLVAGGSTPSGVGDIKTATAELYDPSTGTFSSTGSATRPLAGFYFQSPVPVLVDGTVFLADGNTNAQIYDPAAGTFIATGNMTALQVQPQAINLADGTVLLVGGQDSGGTGVSNGEIFYPSFTSGITITSPTTLPPATQSLLYTQLLLEKGGMGALTWALASGSSPLPTSLALSPNGILSGIPTTSGTFSFSVQVTDSSVPAKTATATYSLVVNSNFQMTLTLDGPLLAINRSFNATVTLATPVPTGSTVTVALAANPSDVVSISPATQTIQAGQTSAVFTLTAGSVGGSVALTATASGYNNATADLTVTSNLISFGTIPVLAPGQSGSLPVSLSFAAPAGGLTINFSSVNTSVATITPSVFVPAGLFIPAANPQVNGIAIGATQITATAVGFAPDTGTVTVTVTDSLSPSSISVNETGTVNVTLTISAAAPAAGITFNLSSDNTAAATVPATVTVPQGQLSVTFAVTGVAQGSANLSVTSPGITTITVPINVGPAPAISISSFIVGNNLVSNGGLSLGAAPTSNGTLTLTSSDPTHFLLSTSPATVGSASITLQLTGGSFNVPAFYVEGQNFSGTTAITATLTASALGYTTGTATVSLYPTGLTFFTGTLNTTTFSSPSPLPVYLIVLNPGTLTYYTYGYPLGPQAPGAVLVSVTSTNTSIGTITGSPASVPVGSYTTSALNFVPATAGTTNLNLAIPTGIFTPADQPVQIAATVSAPPISFNINGGSNIVGNNLLSNGSLSLGAAPPSNETLTLASSDPTHFLLSTSPTTVGSASITLQLTAGSFSVPAFYVEGRNFSGTTAITATLTASASGYASGTATVNLYPTGLTYFTDTLNTTTFSSPSPLTVYLIVLTPGTLTHYAYGYPLGPQAPGAVPVSVTSTNTSVGTITGSPASIGVGTYYTQAISFVPATAGTTNLNLAIPTGYFTPSNQAVQIAATVTAPTINISANSGSFIVGNNLLSNGNVGLGAAPPSNETLTLTSSDPTHFLLSTSPTTVGTASITLQLTAGSFSVPAFYVEGQNFSGTTAITATLTASASGYANGTATVNLYPTGLTYFTGTLSTTTFSAPTPLTVYLIVLNPGTLTYYTSGYPLGPQAPGAAVPVSVTSTNTSVGRITGSPASIGVGTYYTQAINFVPATAGTTNLNLAIPTGYFTPANQSVQIAATVTAPTINISVNSGTFIVGNNLLSNGNVALGAAPPSNETLTLTSSDPTHFLLSTSPTTVGTASITLQLTAGSLSLPAFYVEGRNFSGVGAITATLTASAAGYSDGIATLSLYPTGLTYFTDTLNTTTFSSPTPLTVYLIVLNPGTLTYYTSGYPLGPQAPGAAVPVSVTSTNTNVGTITGSPASIGVGTYYAQAISFVPATAGTTNLNLAIPTGYFTPANQAVQIAATVSAPPISFNINGGSNIVGNNLLSNGSLSLGAAPPSNETLTLTSSDPTHFLLSTSPTTVGSASITLQLTAGSTSAPAFYVEGQNFSGASAITGTLTASAAGYSDGVATLSLYPTGLTYFTGTLNTTTTSGPTTFTVYLIVLNPGTRTFFTYGYPLGPQAPGAVPVSVTSTNTNVGTITGSPASIGLGTYYTQAISFVPATAGITNLNLAIPAGYFTPSNQPVQIVATVQ